MPLWTKESAIDELKKLINYIQNLTTQRRFSADHIQWLMKTSKFLDEVFGQNSRYYIKFKSFQWKETNSFFFGGPGDPKGARNPQAAVERRHQEAYVYQLDSSKGLLLAALDELKKSDIDAVYQGKNTPPESSSILKILKMMQS